MSAPISITKCIRQHIEQSSVGEPFTPAEFREFGSRSAVGHALLRLVRQGFVERLARGLYWRPGVNRFVGKVLPDAARLAAAVARSTGSIVQIHGAEAARRLQLATQMQIQPVFWTSGRCRRLRLGGMEIRLQHVDPLKLLLADRPAGLALAAMWYLGEPGVTQTKIRLIRKSLPDYEFDALMSVMSSMPQWMRDAVARFDCATSSASGDLVEAALDSRGGSV